MTFQDDEKRWKRIQEALAAEAGGRELRPAVSTRTLFGIPSTAEQVIERAVREDEEKRARKRARCKAQAGRVRHEIPPVFDERSRVLLLGTMPSPKSREAGFYYGHPRNRFWQVLAALFDEPQATTTERKRDQLLRHHIALWDVLASCSIQGASDASIADAVPNDLSLILRAAPVQAVFCTGSKAAELYGRHCEAKAGLRAVRLPSTSPANAAASMGDLVEEYRAVLPHLREFQPPTLSVEAVVALERAIANAGTPLSELMERAGAAIAHRVRARSASARTVVLCGNGNNGGDGWVAARVLAAQGHEVTVVTAKQPRDLRAQPARDAALAAEEALGPLGARVLVDPDRHTLGDALGSADVIIDAILGTGFSGDTVKEPFARWITQANERRRGRKGARVVSADCPSGLNAQTGKASRPHIAADETVTMMVMKPGLADARRCGTVHVAPLAYIEPLLDPRFGPSRP